METAEKMEESEDKVLREIIESFVWFYYGDRNQGKPEHSVIASGLLSDQAEFANAADVFETMGLDLGELSQIFVDKPWDFNRISKEDRTMQPIVDNCKKLWKCRLQDKDGWRKLAVLTQKEIRLVSRDEESGEDVIIAVFYPSGEFEYSEKKEE